MYSVYSLCCSFLLSFSFMNKFFLYKKNQTENMSNICYKNRPFVNHAHGSRQTHTL